MRAPPPVRANTSSSIRGKISAPIPIDDEEFPIRMPGASMATPVGSEGMNMQLRSAVGIHQTGIAVSDFSELQASSTPSYTDNSSTPTRLVVQTNLRSSQFTPPTEGSSVEMPERKKKSLKSILGRLFSGKKKASSRSSTQNTNRVRIDQHLSDPSALNRNKQENKSQNRAVSLPVNEYNQALRSHSPFNEIFPQQTLEDSPPTLAARRARARRATTPSRILETPLLEQLDSGLAPRPASSHTRHSKLFLDEGDGTAIGYAVTSGSLPNRRSRSVDGLRQAPPLSRSRSDEIKFWKHQSLDPSIDALSPMSSTKAEPEFQGVEQNKTHPEENVASSVPLQPFNFGEIGEMKITAAASLESRVGMMEKKMDQMEKMMREIHSATIAPNFKGGASSTRKNVDDASVYSLPRHIDRFRSREAENHQYSPSTYSRPSTGASNPDTRPLSTSTTVKVPSSPPPIPSERGQDSMGIEHYTKLVSFVTAEQQQRLRLEKIVERLQTQLHETIRLQSVTPPLPNQQSNIPKLHQHPQPRQLQNPYPAASFPEQVLSSTQQKINTKAPHSAFEADDSSPDDYNEDDGDNDDESGMCPSDVFRTPNESQFQIGQEDDFGIDENDVATMNSYDRDGKKAVRIMSLSQLTLGKNRAGLTATNF